MTARQDVVAESPESRSFAGSTIRAVELETGITALVLRAWERRYGFPKPERRAGSDRRIYSAADVARLKLLREALDRGYRIGDVVAKTNDELAAIIGGSELSSVGASLPAAQSDVDALVRLLARERIDAFDQELRRAKAALDVKSFIVSFAHPLMVAVGDAWEDARLSVRHEHLATESLTTMLRQMLSETQPMGTSPTVLLGALPDEVYTLPLLFVSLYLAASGAKVRVLGAHTPVEEFAAAAATLRPDVVGVSVSKERDADRTRRDLRRLRRRLDPAVALWVGGTGAAAARDVGAVLDSWPLVDKALLAARHDASAISRKARSAASFR